MLTVVVLALGYAIWLYQALTEPAFAPSSAYARQAADNREARSLDTPVAASAAQPPALAEPARPALPAAKPATAEIEKAGASPEKPALSPATPVTVSASEQAEPVLHPSPKSVPAAAPQPASALLAAIPSKIDSGATAPLQKTTRPTAEEKTVLPKQTRAKVPESDPADDSRQRFQRLYQSARRFHQQGKIGQAVGLYQQFLALRPDHLEARINLVSALVQAQQFAKAYPVAVDLMSAQPDNVRVLLNLASVQIGLGRPAKALELLHRLDGQPQAPLFEIAFHKGIAYRQMNQIEQAIAWYRKAEALNSGDSRLLFNLALAFDGDQHYPKAIEYYRKFVAQNRTRDPALLKKIEQRIRALQAYQVQQNLKG